MGGTSDDPGDLGGEDLQEVAQTLRAVARADQRDSEHLALREAWRNRSYADAFRESMLRGDSVVLHMQGGPALPGTLADTGRDFVTLAPSDQDDSPIDVHIGSQDSGRFGAGLVTLEVVQRAATRGTRGTGDDFVAFAARLNEYAYLTEAVPTRRVIVAHRAAEQGWAVVRGELRAFAWDHLYLGTAGGELFVPVAMVAYVRWAGASPPERQM